MDIYLAKDSAVQYTDYLVKSWYLILILSNFLMPQYRVLDKQSLKFTISMKSVHMKGYGLVYNNILP